MLRKLYIVKYFIGNVKHETNYERKKLGNMMLNSSDQTTNIDLKILKLHIFYNKIDVLLNVIRQMSRFGKLSNKTIIVVKKAGKWDLGILYAHTSKLNSQN